MQTLKLNNGVEMPILGFGTYRANGDECRNCVCTAIHAGYRLIDTAQVYGNEDAVGDGIALSGIDRKELFLVTKVHIRAYEHAYASVLDSLRKLKTDYLDLVLLHWPFGNCYAAWRDLEKLCGEGRIRAIGISNFNPDRMIDLIGFNRIVPAVNQVETHLFCQRTEQHKWMQKYGVQHMAYTPLGRKRAGEMFALDEVRALAEKHRKTPAQILLRFLIQQNIAVIPKSVHEERIRENIDIFDFELTAEEQDTLRALDQDAPMIGNPENPEKVETALTW